MLTVLSIRAYDGKARPVGEFQTSIDAVQLWMANPENTRGERLVNARDLVDPDRNNKNYDWDLWVKPCEIDEDLKRAFR